MPAPRPLGPSSSPPQLEEPPPPPFRRLAHRWPYEARNPGWIADARASDAPEHGRFVGRLSAEGSYLSRGLWRSGISARAGSPRVDVDTQLSLYLEAPTILRRPALREGGSPVRLGQISAGDAMYLGDTSFNIAAVALPQVVWRVGVGTRYMLDARRPGPGPREYAMGWNMTSSLDVFPGQPFVISARVDRGMLYQAPVWRARATVGIVHRRAEIFAGYDHTQIGRAALGGPLLGVRAWL